MQRSIGRPHLLHFLITRQRILAVDEAPFLHLALAILDTHAAEIGPHGRLVIDRQVVGVATAADARQVVAEIRGAPRDDDREPAR